MPTEPEGPSVHSLALAAIEAAILFGRQSEQAQGDPAQDPAVMERQAVYLRRLDALAADGTTKAIEELVSFAAGAVLRVAVFTEADPLEILREIATWPRD
jgi:hypothetical protein